jgi:predicted MFS family arabinose efflux permease
MGSAFLSSLGTGLFSGAATNFYVDTLGLSGSQVLWLAGLRELPGLALVFIAALMVRWRPSRRAALAVAVMGLGYALHAPVNTFGVLVLVSVIASLGFHVWLPLQPVLALGLTTRERSGLVLGTLSSVQALATILGIGVVALLSRLVGGLSLRVYYVIGGALIVAAAAILLRLPNNTGAAKGQERRLLLRRCYWLYYVLTFFEGSRTQVFNAFGTLILVQNYDLKVWQISALLLVSSVVNFFAVPWMGRLIDRIGERWVLSVGYALLALCFVGYATIHHALVLAFILVAIYLLVMLTIGLSTYVHRIAPADELSPTLSAGVSINHITSVTMSLLAGTLLAVVGYEALCWGAAAIIALSVPFALAMRVEAPEPAAEGAA